MKKIILIILTILLLFSFMLSVSAAEESLANDVTRYYTYAGYGVDGASDEYYKALEPTVEYWKEKFNEMRVDDVRYFKYHPEAEGGVQKLVEYYFENDSLLSATVSVTSPEIEKIVTYVTIEQILLAAETDLDFFKNKDLDFYNIVCENNIIHSNGTAPFDPNSPDLRMYLIRGYNCGYLLAITDGTYEVYYVLDWWRDKGFGHEKQLYSPMQICGLMLSTGDWGIEREEVIGANYTKEAPSTGGSEVVGVAVLCAGASLLGAVAGAVLSRKKGSAK